MIAATALVARMPLIHNNASDFESIRSAINAHGTVPNVVHGIDPLCIAGMKLACSPGPLIHSRLMGDGGVSSTSP
jgi:hypothetical protein